MARSRRQFDKSWVPDPGTVLDGRYRLDEMVDRGGMGVIMRGEHLGMKREVAVKLLSPDIATEDGYRARFRREVDLAATIEHPNIVRCYDFGETDDGVLYLVMELLDGRSLKETLAEEGRMDAARLSRLMVQALDGMSTAHLQHIVHRDLKPSNIFVVKDHRGEEVVKVLDFGLAKSLMSDHLTLTKTGAICGTASYVTPESPVIQEIGTAGDVYATGLIMLEMLIGRQVCRSRAMAQTFLQHLVVPARIPRRVWDSPLGPVLAKSLQKHPEDRYPSAEEMYQALKAVADDVPVIRLEPAELPPLPPDDLDNALLMQLGNGEYATIDALRELPAPEPWDLDSEAPDAADTLRGVMVSLDQMHDGSTMDEAKKSTPRVEAWADEVPTAQLSPPDDEPEVDAPQSAPPAPIATKEAFAITQDSEPPPTRIPAQLGEPEPTGEVFDLDDDESAPAPAQNRAMVLIALALSLLTLVILLLT